MNKKKVVLSHNTTKLFSALLCLGILVSWWYWFVLTLPTPYNSEVIH